jgi:hypothetical protein
LPTAYIYLLGAAVDGAMKHLIAMAVNDNADVDAFVESFDRTVTPVAVQSIVRKHLGFHWGVQYLPPVSIIELRLERVLVHVGRTRRRLRERILTSVC